MPPYLIYKYINLSIGWHLALVLGKYNWVAASNVLMALKCRRRDAAKA